MNRRSVIKWCIPCVLLYGIVGGLFLMRWSTPYLTVISPCVCQSTDTSPRSHLVGQTQLEQYRQWMNMKTHGSKEEIRNETKYVYNVITVQATRRCSDIRVRLDEFYDGKRTYGGSGFLSLTDSSSERELCSYTDYFNGTYTIWCPPPPPECAVLTIHLQYVNFMAYYDKPEKPQAHLVLRRSVCPWSDITGCTTRGHRNSPVTWVRSEASWTVAYVHGRPVATFLDVNKICRCVSNKFDRIVFAGSSHIRYKFDYIMSNCYGDRFTLNVVRKHRTFTVNNTHFYETMYSSDFASIWNGTLQQLNLTRSSIVFFQTGAHDVTNRGIKNTMGRNLDAYVNTLVDMKNHADMMGFKMVIITSPPYPDHDRIGPRGNRNNYALAALSRLLQDKLSTHGFTVFDEFGVILPQQNNDTQRCGFHYLCRIPGKGTHGYVGTAAMRMLMTAVCTEPSLSDIQQASTKRD